MVRHGRPPRIPWEIGVARVRFTLARDSGHSQGCALAFAHTSSLEPMTHCVCGLRAKVARYPIRLLALRAPSLLTAAERAEAEHRLSVKQSTSRLWKLRGA